MTNDKDISQLIANTIIRYRESKEMSQVDLAKELGVSKSTISLYEDGKRKPKLNTLIRLMLETNVWHTKKIKCPYCNGTGQNEVILPIEFN